MVNYNSGKFQKVCSAPCFVSKLTEMCTRQPNILQLRFWVERLP